LTNDVSYIDNNVDLGVLGKSSTMSEITDMHALKIFVYANYV